MELQASGEDISVVATAALRAQQEVSVEPKRGVSKPTVAGHMFPNRPSIIMNKLQTAVPNKKAYFYAKELGENHKP